MQEINANGVTSYNTSASIAHRMEMPALPAIRGVPGISCVHASVNLKTIHALAATNLITPDRSNATERTKQISEVNERFKWTTAQIGSLFKAIASNGIVTEQDAVHIEALRQDLQSIASQLTEVDQKAATEPIQRAYGELDRLDALRQFLPHYREDESRLEEALLDVTSHDNGPLCSFEAAAESLQLFAALSSQIDTQHPLHPFLQETTKWFIETMDDWGDDLRRCAEGEMEHLTRVLSSDPNNQAALQLLVSLEERLWLAKDQLKVLAKTAQTLHLPKVAKSLRQASRELGHVYDQRPHSSSAVEGLPPIYGSEQWKELMTACPKPERGWVASLLHPEEWSDRTKDRVFRLFALSQLFQKGVGFVDEVTNSEGRKAQADALQREVIKAVPKEIQAQIGKEESILQRYLTEKYSSLSNPAILDALTKKYPEIRPALQKTIEQYGPRQPSAAEIKAIGEAYSLHRLIQSSPVADPTKHMDFDQWLQAFTTFERKELPQAKLLTAGPLPNATAATQKEAPGVIERFGRWLGVVSSSAVVPSHQTFVNDTCAHKQTEIIQTVQKARTIHDQLATSPAVDLEPLRELVALSLGALMQSAREMSRGNLSLVELADLMQQIDDQCFAIEELEKWIFESMAPLRQATMGDKDQLLEGGTKHAHLVLMDRAYGAVPIPGAYVPQKSLVKGNHVQDLLKARAPQVDTYRAQLAERFSRHVGDPAIFLDDPEVLAILRSIDTAMVKAFEHHDAVVLIESYPELRELIADVARKKGHLITRSTAPDEDTAEVTNAGGNESVPYVEPTAKEVAKAVGEVARSYYSPNSLRIRLNAGQKPFGAIPSFPVIVMEHVGEPIGGALNSADIPVGVVDFTNRQDYTGGGLRLMTTSATFGQGSSIVKRTVGVNVDRAFMWASRVHPDRLNILYTNVDKPARLGPVEQTSEGGVVFGLLENPPELRRSPALNSEMLHRFYHSAIFDEAYFGDVSTDRESAVIGGQKARLQARAYDKESTEERQTTATFLDIQKVAQQQSSPITEILQGELLVNEKASFLPITNREQVLVAHTLDEAERQFVKGRHELVIVQMDEPETSHAYVNFKQLKIPCLIVKDSKAIKDLLTKVDDSHPLAVCTQTAALHLWDISKGDMQQFVTNGYAVHPARMFPSIQTTLDGPSIKPSRDVPQDAKDLFIAVRAAGTREEALKKLQELQRHSWLVHIRERGAFARQQVASGTSLPPEIRERYNTIAAFCDTLEWHLEEFEAVLKEPAANRLEQLLNHKVVEALLIGRPNKGSNIGEFSVVDILAIDRDIDQLVAYQKALSQPAHLMDLVLTGNKAISAAGIQQWTDFLMQLEPLIGNGTISQAQVSQFKTFIATLQQANVMAPWLTIYFPNVLQGAPIDGKLIDSLIQTLPSDEGPFVAKQLQAQQDMKEMKNQIEHFGDPESFAEVWEALKLLASPERQNSLTEALTSHSPVAQMIALSTMKELVDLFDAALKATLSPNKWDDEEKVPVFKEMLKPFFGLLTTWFHNADEFKNIPIAHSDGSASAYSVSYSVSGYLNQLRDILDGMPDQGTDQLLPGEDEFGGKFSVMSAALGSGTDYAFSNVPITLVDAFTTIHQSMLNAIGTLNNDLFSTELIAKSTLPQFFQDAMTMVSRSYPNRLTLDVEEDSVVTKFNVPLRSHSSTITLTFDKQTGDLVFEAQFMGKNEMHRWSFLQVMAEALSQLKILPMAHQVKVEDELATVSWNVSGEGQVQTAIDQFRKMGFSTMYYTFTDYFNKLVSKLSDDQRSQMYTHVILAILMGKIFAPDDLEEFHELAFTVFVTRHLAFKEALAAAEIALTSSDPSARAVALSWAAKALRPDNQDKVLALGRAGIADPSPLVRAEAIKIYTALVANRVLPPDEALTAARSGVADPSPLLRAEVVSLYQRLLSEGLLPHGEAVAVAKMGLNEPNPIVNERSIGLIEDLLKREPSEVPEETRIIAMQIAEARIRESVVTPILFSLLNYLSKQDYKPADEALERVLATVLHRMESAGADVALLRNAGKELQTMAESDLFDRQPLLLNKAYIALHDVLDDPKRRDAIDYNVFLIDPLLSGFTRLLDNKFNSPSAIEGVDLDRVVNLLVVDVQTGLKSLLKANRVQSIGLLIKLLPYSAKAREMAASVLEQGLTDVDFPQDEILKLSEALAKRRKEI